MQATAVSLEDKYSVEEGSIILSGIQALVRLPLDQHRADRRAGLNTATLISGYRGSPLGGLDTQLHSNRKRLEAHQVTFLPGVNEDLGATAVLGSQMANLLPRPRYDGVLGMWYGKAPGVDRSGDVFKHANFLGAGRYGGVLAIAGDDPVAKSSTLPSQSEFALFDAQIPVLYPGSVQEVIEYGRYGFELSRYSGLWVGLKIVTNVADAYATATVRPLDIQRPDVTFQGRPWRPTQTLSLVAPFSLAIEREIVEGRMVAAHLFAAANHLNRIVTSSPSDWIGLVAAGKTFYDLREALQRLGFDDDTLRRSGIRVLKIGMPYPLDPDIVRQFARGLREIVVVEEKRPFVELFVRDALYDLSDRPAVVGKTDGAGRRLVPGFGELDPETIMPLLVERLAPQLHGLSPPPVETRKPPTSVRLELLPVRQAYFCSGCPHNRSTSVPAGALAAGGMGCHGMVLTMDRQTQGIIQMGGEGVHWAGASFFSETPHLFQNLGDGTLFHSGTLAIRQAVAANTNVTYKILYNDAVAMTGGQRADGNLPVPELAQALHTEGVRRIIVCADNAGKYPRHTRWPPGVKVWPRDRLEKAQEVLQATPGVTVLIYDQPCAAVIRRKRKRGQVAEPTHYVFINERACEGCGDCGVKSNCLSVHPVETEFGRKTRVHQSSCNQDDSCLAGDCPAFVTVSRRGGPLQGMTMDLSLRSALDALANPRRLPEEATVYMVGIGGTGVVTASQILSTAAWLEGQTSQCLDQTGLSQKGGPVVSHLKIRRQPWDGSSTVGARQATLYLAFDILSAAADDHLRHAAPEQTIAVVSTSRIPTGRMVVDAGTRFPDEAQLRWRIDSATRAPENLYLDAVRLSEAVWGTHMMGNLILVGAAYQSGLLPMQSTSIERAIELNGVSVQDNVLAFRLGRLAIANPGAAPFKDGRRPDLEERRLVPAAECLIGEIGGTGELDRLLRIRVPELIEYQDETYARSYAGFVKRVLEAERKLGTGQTRLAEAVARHLFKLMAYKDEYEVARLFVRGRFRASVDQAFGRGAGISYRLHPPFLRALGVRRKMRLAAWWCNPLFRLLHRLRRVRGTALDVFGYAGLRRIERELIREYLQSMERELRGLTPASYDRAIEIANLPDLIRGYEGIKRRNIDIYRESLRRHGEESSGCSLM